MIENIPVFVRYDGGVLHGNLIAISTSTSAPKPTSTLTNEASNPEVVTPVGVVVLEGNEDPDINGAFISASLDDITKKKHL